VDFRVQMQKQSMY